MDRANYREGWEETRLQPGAGAALRPCAPEITFGDFAALAKRNGWGLDSLAERFRGKIDHPREFFKGVVNRNNASTVIPFNSVIAFFNEMQERGLRRVPDLPGRTCACGCGALVPARKKWASAGCRKRAQRTRSVMAGKPSPKCLISHGAKVGQIGSRYRPSPSEKVGQTPVEELRIS